MSPETFHSVITALGSAVVFILGVLKTHEALLRSLAEKRLAASHLSTSNQNAIKGLGDLALTLVRHAEQTIIKPAKADGSITPDTKDRAKKSVLADLEKMGGAAIKTLLEGGLDPRHLDATLDRMVEAAVHDVNSDPPPDDGAEIRDITRAIMKRAEPALHRLLDQAGISPLTAVPGPADACPSCGTKYADLPAPQAPPNATVLPFRAPSVIPTIAPTPPGGKVTITPPAPQDSPAQPDAPPSAPPVAPSPAPAPPAGAST